MGIEDIKNNPPVYTTQEGVEEIKNNRQVYTTQEGIEVIKSNPRVYTTQEWLGRLQTLETGLDVSLSFLSTSRRRQRRSSVEVF